MGKKGEVTLGLNVIVVLIVAIVFVLIFLFWVKGIDKGLGDYTICKASNIENANKKLKIGVPFIANQVITESVGNKCQTEYLDVPKNQEKFLIANKLAACWDQYLEGRERLFETEDNNYCAICSVLEFEDKKKITDLTSYLIKKEVPKKAGLNYYDYLNRVVITKNQLEIIENEELHERLGSVDTGTRQAILYVESKDVNPGSLTGESSIVLASKGSAIGAVAGLVTLVGFGLCSTLVGCSVGIFFVAAGAGTHGYLMGSDDDPDIDSRILLWPYEDLVEINSGCTILEGQDQLDIKKF